MGLFKKLKGAIKGVAKIAVKTAPIWTNFIPVGGTFVNTALQKVAPLLDKTRSMRGVGAALLKKGVAPQRMTTVAGGINLYETAMRGAPEQEAIDAFDTPHAGIRGPVPSHWGPKHRIMRATMPRAGGMRRARRATRRTGRPYATRRRATGRRRRSGRNRYGQFTRGRRAA